MYEIYELFAYALFLNFQNARIMNGEKVLITAAAGGAGHIAVSLNSYYYVLIYKTAVIKLFFIIKCNFMFTIKHFFYDCRMKNCQEKQNMSR